MHRGLNKPKFDNATHLINTTEAKQPITALFIPAVQLLWPYFRDYPSSVCRLNWYKVTSLTGTADILDNNLNICKSQIYSNGGSEQ